MTRHIVTVAGRRFFVDGDELVSLRERLIQAVRRGGEFISLRIGGAQVDALVTPGLPVFIEELEPELEAAGAAAASAIAMPVDEFDDWGI